jgi:3-oxoacyl-[acyl-carrier-protein] synthase-3
MGTIISATGICTNKTTNSSVDHAVEAGLACLKSAGVDVKDVDLLINVGIYRDENIGEPAMAALIQKGIGMKCDYTRGQAEQALFSVDLMNSACGLINGIQVSDSLLKIKKIKYSLIVSSDTHPSSKASEGFPFSCVGGAMLLEYVEDDTRGFKNFSFKNSKTIDHSITGYVDMSERDTEARERITINVPEDYHSEILKFTNETVSDYLSSSNVDKSNLKLITPQVYEGFGKKVAESAEVGDESIVDLYKEHGDSHSSALTMAYNEGSKKGLYKKCDQVLFVAAGAGLSAACVLYSV